MIFIAFPMPPIDVERKKKHNDCFLYISIDGLQ